MSAAWPLSTKGEIVASKANRTLLQKKLRRDMAKCSLARAYFSE